MTTPTLQPGHVIGGRWTVRSFLRGDGALATYIVAGANGTEQVLKLLAPELTRRPDLMTNLQRVHVLQNDLPGETVSRILDAGIDGTGAPFVIASHLAARALGRPQAAVEVAEVCIEAAGAAR